MNHQAVGLVCALLLALGVTLWLTPEQETVSFSPSHPLPVDISADSPLQISLQSLGVFAKVRLQIESDSRVAVDIDGKRYVVGPGTADYGTQLGTHGEEVESGWMSNVVLGLSDARFLSVYPTEERARIESLSCGVVKYKHATTLSALTTEEFKGVFWVGGVVLAFILLVRRVRPAWAEWGGIAFSVGLLVLNEFAFAGVVVVFLSGMYMLRRRINDGNGSLARLLLFMVTAGLFMVVFKYLKVHLFTFTGEFSGFSLLLPLGVSYFVIRLIDIQLRWFRGQSLDYTYREYLHYMLFPGTLLAGPIESIQDFYDKRVRSLNASDYAYGIGRTAIGLVKKLIIADVILFPAIHGEGVAELIGFNDGLSANVLMLDAGSISGGSILLFGFTCLLFAYVDFSAYTDIAIGVSRLMGHRIRENFNFPLLAPNIREFWQRWHMSLSEWSFRNAYFPLLMKTRNSYVPLYVTMLVIGMWHAPNLSWYSWAFHHATGMTAVAMLPKLKLPGWGDVIIQPLRIAMTVTFVSLGFLFVYFTDYGTGLHLYAKAWGWLLTFGAL